MMKKWQIITIGALLLLIVAGLIGGKIGFDRAKSLYSDIVVTHDTVTIVEKIEVPTSPVIDTMTETVYVPYKVVVHDTVNAGDTTDVDLPYVSAHAVVPDTLDIWYHGYIDIGIDSIKYSLYKTTEMITEKIEVPKYVMPRFSINAGIGVAYIDKPLGFAGGEFTYNAKISSWSAFGGYCTDFNGENKPYFGGKVTLRLNIP